MNKLVFFLIQLGKRQIYCFFEETQLNKKKEFKNLHIH